MNKTIAVQINFFGPFLKKEDIPRIPDPKLSESQIKLNRELLTFFFELPFTALSKEILERYVEATEIHMSIVPHTKAIFQRLLKPLRSAKKCYCLGDYAATIALCGTVGEMLAILLWKINDITFKGKPITEQDEKGIFGGSFENLGQDKRLRVLKTFGHINETQYKSFDDVRKKRKPYLHLWTADLRNEQDDALDVLKKSFQLFNEVAGIDLADARTLKKVDHRLMKFLEEHEIKS